MANTSIARQRAVFLTVLPPLKTGGFYTSQTRFTRAQRPNSASFVGAPQLRRDAKYRSSQPILGGSAIGGHAVENSFDREQAADGIAAVVASGKVVQSVFGPGSAGSSRRGQRKQCTTTGAQAIGIRVSASSVGDAEKVPRLVGDHATNWVSAVAAAGEVVENRLGPRGRPGGSDQLKDCAKAGCSTLGSRPKEASVGTRDQPAAGI